MRTTSCVRAVFELPEVEKLKYDVGNSGNSFGYSECQRE